MWRSVRTPDLTVKGKAGWCLSVAEDVWATPHMYNVRPNNRAITAWNDSSATNHPGQQPPNVPCILYWTFTDISDGQQYGHIATWVPGRGIYSSPFNVNFGSQWFPSVQAVTDRINEIRGANSAYLGWSETLAGVRLVQYSADSTNTGGNDVADKVNLDTARIMTNGILARNGVAGRSNTLDGGYDVDLNANHVGTDLTNAYVQELFLSDEAKQWRDSQDANSVSGINTRLASADQMSINIKQLQDAVALATSDDTTSKKSLQVALDQVRQLTDKLEATTPVGPVKTVVVDPTYFTLSQLFTAIISKVKDSFKSK